MNLFIEGLQGSGKSTLAQQLAVQLPNHSVFQEGDYSPVELAWCAWMNEETYDNVLSKYAALRKEIEEKTVTEGPHRIMCYTKIHTSNADFFRDMEQFEIYNGRIALDEFARIIMGRFENWNGENQIFECSIFQNIIDDLILFRCMSDEEILRFYERIRNALQGKHYRIIYLKSENIEQNINHIRKERSDAEGNELWFPTMLDYFNHCPYAKKNNKNGWDDLMEHLHHRQHLELRLLNEVFADKAIILKSKSIQPGDFSLF